MANPFSMGPKLLTDPGRVRKIVWGAAGMAIGSNILALTQPIFMLHVYDYVLPSQSVPTLGYLFLIAVFLIGVQGVLDMLRQRQLMDAAAEVDRQTRPRVLLAALQGDLRRASPQPTRFTQDLDTIRTFVSGGGASALMDLPWTPIFLIALLLLSPWIALVTFIMGAVIFALAWRSDSMVRGLMEESGEKLAHGAKTASDLVQARDSVRSMGMIGAGRARWNAQTQAAVDIQRRASERVGGTSATVRSLRIIVQVALLGMAALLVLAGQLSPGSMIACSIIGARALGPLDQVSNAWRGITQARIAWTKLAEAAKLGDQHDKPRTNLPAPAGAIQAENLVVMAPGREQPLLARVAFDLPAGSFTGLIGPSGAGKSTLLRVLAGGLAPDQGAVRVDGAALDQYPLDSLGRHVGYAPQTTWLMNGTVAENIRRLNPPDDAGVIAAAQAAGVHDLILSLPQGYDTQVGDGGAALSVGQRARVAMARACYGDPKIFILDEPFASLDTEGEAALWALLRRLRDRKVTLVMATHRPSQLRGFDTIIALVDGRVAKMGKAADILKDMTPQQAPAPVTA